MFLNPRIQDRQADHTETTQRSSRKKDQKALRRRPHGPLRVLSSVKTRSKALQKQLHTKQLLYNQQEEHDKANGISDPDGNPDSEPECKSLTKKDTDKPRQFSG